MKYKVKVKNGSLIVTAATTGGETIDPNALAAFADIGLRGFLRPRLLKKNVVEYTGPAGISLAEHLRRPVTKRDFFFIVEQILVDVQKLWSNGLFLNRMVLTTQNAYINTATREVQFLYLPTVQELRNDGVRALLETLARTAKPAPETDMDYLNRFLQYLGAQRTFDPAVIEAYIAHEDRTVVTAVKRQQTTQSGFMTSKQRSYYEHYDNKAQQQGAAPAANPYTPPAQPYTPPAQPPVQPYTPPVQPVQPYTPPVQPYIPPVQPVQPYNPVAETYAPEEMTGARTSFYSGGVPNTAATTAPSAMPVAPVQPAPMAMDLDDDEPTGLLSENAVMNLPAVDDDPTGLLDDESTLVLPQVPVMNFSYPESEATTLLVEEPETEATTLLVDEEEPVHYPTLQRDRNGDTVEINKPVFRLGKERSYVDYFVSDNSAVSRSHADIITRDGRCFVVDLNSTNHTYINGQRLVVQVETEIKDGDRLKLGNEEFTFYA